jgi:type I restriction enzyme S subunit
MSSGDNGFSVIPASWTWASLDAVCTKIQDGTHFSPKAQFQQGEYKYITAKNIRPTGLDLGDITYLHEEDHRKIYERCDPRYGDVLLVKDGVNTGDAALNTLHEEFSLLSSVALLRPNPVVLRGSFLRYYLLSPLGQAMLTGQMTGSAIRRIVLRRIRTSVAPIPPLCEQDRIVAAIEENLTRLEAGVAGLERVRAKLKRQRAAVLKAACEGRLVPTEAELARAEGRPYEPADRLLARILQARREQWEREYLAALSLLGRRPKDDRWKARYPSPPIPDTGGLPGLPDGWCWASLGMLIASGPQNGLYLPKERYGRGHPILRIEDYQDGMSRSSEELRRVQADEAQVESYGMRTGDLIINRVNSPSHLGKCLVVEHRNLPALFESNMMRIGLSHLVDGRYIASYLRSRAGRTRLTQNAKWAVNQASINQTDVEEVAVPLPPLAEQGRIAAEVERRLSLIDALDAAASANLKRAETLRQAILKRAFEGKLVPQDPADEPATALLERIAGEPRQGRLFDAPPDAPPPARRPRGRRRG